MRRLVYSPKAYVFIKDSSGTIHDVSAYVTEGSVSRRIDQVSSASFTLRNPDKMFTAHRNDDGSVTKPKFYPMDAVTIFLQRVRDRPVRVFTGFLDTAPYLQLFPGMVTFTASCTIKRLQYTYFDPALPFTQTFLNAYGWLPYNGQWVSSDAFNEFIQDDKDERTTPAKKGGKDGSLANLLYAVLKHIGRWNPDDVYIEKLDPQVFERMMALAQEYAKDNKEVADKFIKLMKDLAGADAYGSPDNPSDSSSGSVDSQDRLTAKNFPVTPIKWTLQGKASFFGDSRKYHYDDPGDDSYGSQKPASGLDPDVPGFACRNSLTLGGWFVLRAPNGNAAVCQHTDMGPAPGTAREFDINTPGTHLFGYSEKNFPTDQGIWRGKFFGKGKDGKKSADDFIKKYGNISDPQDPNPRANASSTAGVGDGPTASASSRQDTSVDSTQRSPTRGGTQKDSGSDVKVYNPIPQYNDSARGPYGEQRPGHIHSGLDIGAPHGSPLIAPADGHIGGFSQTTGFAGGGMIHFVFDNDVGDIKAGTVIGFGHASEAPFRPGHPVKAGQRIGASGTSDNGFPHVHFVRRTNSDKMDGNPVGNDPTEIWNALKKGTATLGPGVVTGGSPGTNDPGGSNSPSAIGATFFGAFELPGMFEQLEATLLGGEKSLLNDKPLLPFVQQLCNASLRHFQSLPDGRFYAFFPDYFGEMNAHPPYWNIDDIEILDGKIDLTDDALVTHMYVVGDTLNPMEGGSTFAARAIHSSGVVTVFNMLLADGVLNSTEKEKKNKNAKSSKSEKNKDDYTKTPPVGMGTLMERKEVAEFLDRYGARPVVEDMPMIRSPFYEMFLSYQKFLLSWSRQFATPFTFTFMPELYPGGKVGFPTHSLQMYIEEVTHSWSYESGFMTTATLSAPSVYSNGETDNRELIPDGFVNAIIEPARKKP